MDILSIVLGVIALVTAFTPFIWLQVVGGCVGIAGIVLARRAKRADYRKSLTTAIGMLCSVTGALLCFVAPVLSLFSNVALFFMTR
ncbi:hypothetical protein INF26_01410 [Olsenella sp. DSM 107455]|uniref:DUF4190 domain-containing protein n=1 Tax=Thermophilibacter gallinarum TaxID=2779357 RepID=A0ABR9QR01_9ACTN|nr:hypothetical protein [Thermophilibacter gallinarum]MBE5023511.1 hypothetical protein [Thermophilibacter gallinarum]